MDVAFESKESTIRVASEPSANCSINLPICVNNCCPEKPTNDTLVNHHIYLLSNNPKTKFADWVAYKIDVENMNGSTHSRHWKRDPKLPADETLSPPDYKGAYAAHRYDRGHQAPLASFSNNVHRAATNLLSNITPQKAALNRSNWVYLEKAVRELARKHPDSNVYVITGPLYEFPMPALSHSHLPHQVPSGYFKVFTLQEDEDVSVAAFLFEQTDAYKGYDFVKRKTGIIHLGCMAHARRYFADIVKTAKTPGLALEAIQFFKALYKIEGDSKDLSFDDRYKTRQEKAHPILTEFKAWLDKNILVVPDQFAIGKAIHYCLNHWTQLTNYLKNGLLSIDNNFIENEIRPFALGRKNWMFKGSPREAKAGAIFYSLLATCRANQINPEAYLVKMLSQIKACKTPDDFRKLLPYHIGL